MSGERKQIRINEGRNNIVDALIKIIEATEGEVRYHNVGGKKDI